jgi:hypothetical protein
MKVRNLRLVKLLLSVAVLTSCLAPTCVAQQQAAVVPTLVKFSGTLNDINGRPLTGVTGVTFLFYKDEQGGPPLWMETQNVTPDKSGHYTVALGSTTAQGLPTDLFASGEARWLGVQAQGQAEQPRVLLLSVPYALKAGDAQTVGGLPASAFVLAAPAGSNAAPAANNTATAEAATSASPLTTSNVTTSGGTANTIPMFTTATNIQNSILTQTGTAAINVAGKLNLPATGTATTSGGRNSQPHDFVASAYNSSSKAAVAQTFQLQAEPTGNNTATPAGTLSLLYGSGTTTPAETGLKISSKGLITFATGQTFPGTITDVKAGTALTGGGTTGTVTLNIDTTKIPQLSVANTFTGNQTVKGNLSDTGNITATGSITGQTANFTANNGTQVVKVTQNGGGSGLVASAVNGLGSAVAAMGGLYGVYAQSLTGFALYGSTTNGTAVVGDSSATVGSAIVGQATNNTAGASTVGVTGSSAAPFGIGSQGLWSTASTVGKGTLQVGVWGDSSAGDGVHGTSDSSLGVLGQSANFHGVAGFSNGPSAAGVMATNTNGGYGVYATTTSGGTAGYFQGNVQTTGLITTYNGLQTYGNGVPSIVFEFENFSGGSGSTGYVNLYTPTNDGVFRLSLFQECTSTSGGGTYFAPSFIWTLPTGGSSGYGDIGGPDCSSLNGFTETFVLHVKGGTTVQWEYPGMNASFQNLILIEQLL